MLIPSMLPPPTPWKAFVFGAGVFEMKILNFMLAVFCGRLIHYLVLAFLTIRYGPGMVHLVADLCPSAPAGRVGRVEPGAGAAVALLACANTLAAARQTVMRMQSKTSRKPKKTKLPSEKQRADPIGPPFLGLRFSVPMRQRGLRVQPYAGPARAAQMPC